MSQVVAEFEHVTQFPLQAKQVPAEVLKKNPVAQLQVPPFGVPPNLQVRQLLLFPPLHVAQVP